MGVPSLNDLAVDGTLNTTNQPTNQSDLIRILRAGVFCEGDVGVRVQHDRSSVSQIHVKPGTYRNKKTKLPSRVMKNIDDEICVII